MQPLARATQEARPGDAAGMTDTPAALPQLALGRRPASDRPTLKARRFLTGVVPEHPAAVNHLDAATYDLYRNDQFGVCGVASLAHYICLVTAHLAGGQRTPTWDDVVALYRTQNPGFDPALPGGGQDEGVEMKKLLADAVKHGLGQSRILGFAEIDLADPEEVRAAVAIFGGVLLGLDLDMAQAEQLAGGVWEYVERSPQWGGHAVMEGGYSTDPYGEDIVTWGTRVRMTREFVRRQRAEAYVVILPEHLTDRGFLDGWDLSEFAAAYEQITDRAFPVPLPAPVVDEHEAADDALAAAVHDWAHRRTHRGATRTAAAALRTWLQATGRA